MRASGTPGSSGPCPRHPASRTGRRTRGTARDRAGSRPLRPPYDRKTPWSSQTCVLLDRTFRVSGVGDVPRDLLDQLVPAAEAPFLPQPPPELDVEPVAVEVAGPVEQVRLDTPLRAPV